MGFIFAQCKPMGDVTVNFVHSFYTVYGHHTPTHTQCYLQCSRIAPGVQDIAVADKNVQSTEEKVGPLGY